jgi:ParB-like chromosome segregation protein Spo0J
MKTKQLPVETLIPYAGNPRKNDHAVETVAAAISRFGFRVPVLAKSDGSIIDGHLRVKAAKHLGMKDVPVVLCDDLSEADIKALRISINRVAELAEWDTELLSSELASLQADGVTLGVMGFDDDALKNLGVAVVGEQIATIDQLVPAQVLEGGQRGLTAKEKLDVYEHTTLRQIMLIMDVNEFGETMGYLDAIKQAKGAGTNTEAALLAIKEYANTCS